MAKKSDPRSQLSKLLEKNKKVRDDSRYHSRLSSAATARSQALNPEILKAVEDTLKANMDVFQQYRWVLEIYGGGRHSSTPQYYILRAPIKKKSDPISGLLFGHDFQISHYGYSSSGDIIQLAPGIKFVRYNQGTSNSWYISFVGACHDPSFKDNKMGEPVRAFIKKYGLRVGLDRLTLKIRKEAQEEIAKVEQLEDIVGKGKKK